MKTFAYIFSLCAYFFSVSCTVKAPDLLVIGVQTQEALTFLEEYQDGKKKEEEFDHYLQQLRVNYAPGFEWDQYWSRIEEKKLYQNLEEKKLHQILSLNKISCEDKNWVSFSKLILQIAESDSEKLLFSKHLTHLQRTCSTWLPNPAFKSILQFLSEKRMEQEAEKIAEEKQAYLENREVSHALFQKEGAEPREKKYIYTGELQTVLMDEWSRKHTARNWNDVLEVVDRSFWSDARWINYQNKSREYLQGLMEMEWSTYNSIEQGLNLDILLMFGENDKMEDIIKLYKGYLSVPETLNWPVLWDKILLKYPVKPENGNVEVLLSLYERLFCRDEELSAYLKIVDQWEMPSYRKATLSFCEEFNRRQVLKFFSLREIQNMLRTAYDEVFRSVTKEARREALEEAEDSMYHLLDESLKVPPKIKEVLGYPVKIGARGSRSVKEAEDVLLVYGREQYNYSKEHWRSLLDKHFSQQDWLFVMRAFRDNKDNLSLRKILEMYHYIYGEISFLKFLQKNIQAILIFENLSLKGISDRYGYKASYLNKPEIRDLFWSNLKNSLKKDPGNLVKALSVYKEETRYTPAELADLLKEYFVEDDWLDLMLVLRTQENYSVISEVLEMHYEIYDGKISFLNRDIYAILQSEAFSLSELDTYGYKEDYVNAPDVRRLFWKDIENSITDADLIDWGKAFKEGVDICSYSYMQELFLFFSELGHEEVLFNQFRFKDCALFIKEFREKEWDQLVQIVYQKASQLDEIQAPSFIWWLARILFLYSGENEFFIKELVSKVGKLEWQNIITGMLNSYIFRSYERDNYLFHDLLHKVKLAYNENVELALCSFLSQEKIIHFLIQEYDPKWLMDLFYELSWSENQLNGRRHNENIYCSKLISIKKRHDLLYELSKSLFQKKDLEREESLPLTDSLSDIWSIAVQIMDLSVKMNGFKSSSIWSPFDEADMKRKMNNNDFHIKFSDQILEKLLSAANGDESIVLDHLINHIWKKPPASSYHKTHRDWLEKILRDKIGGDPFAPQREERNTPLPSFGQNWENKANIQRVSALSYSQNTDGETVSNNQKLIQNLSLDSESDYGQIFIEEISSADDFNYKVSVFGGMEVGSPYLSSYFSGLEIQGKIHPLIYLGLDYSFHDSKPNSTVKAMKNTYEGLDISYPFLKHTFYLSGHYHVFKSHLNLAGLYKIRLKIPLQVGVGFMSMEKSKAHISMKWGLGPHIQLSPRWGTQILFFQTVSAKRFQFLYSWLSLVATFGF